MNNVKGLRDSELKVISEIVRDYIFVPSYEKKTTIFLCGADLNDKTTGRYKISKLFDKYPRYELLYPEDLFDDLLVGQGQHSLLTLENILAECVDSIVIIPESPGSFAELGVFSNDERLVNKLICVGNKKYSKKKSFINYGPVKLIKASDTGSVFNVDFSDLDDEINKIKMYKTINNAITKIKKKYAINKDIANILETENYVLPCIYLIDSITSRDLFKLVEYATKHDKKIAEIATKSSIGRLIKCNYIVRTTTGYSVTKQGIHRIRTTLSNKYLDVLRLEIMNSQNRFNTVIKAINF